MEIKDRIAVQAGELFMQRGVKSTSMDEIASRLGMSKRTIYQHFSDKEDLLIYFLNYKDEEFKRIVTQQMDEKSTIIELVLFIIDFHRGKDIFKDKNYFDDIAKYYPRVQQKIDEKDRLRGEQVKEFLQLGIKQGVVRESLNVDVTAFLLKDMGETFAKAATLISRNFSDWELFFTMMINFVRGISSEKGIKIVDEYLEKVRSQKTEVRSQKT